MTLAALLDLGLPREPVDAAIEALGLREAKLVVTEGFAGAIGCLHVDVRVAGRPPERNYSQIRRMIDAAALPLPVRDLSHRIFLRLARAEAEVHRTSLDAVHFHEVGGVDAIVDIVGVSALLAWLEAKVQASPLPLGRGFVDCRHGRLPLPAPAALLCLEGVPTLDAGLSLELVTPTGAAIVAELAEAFVAWPSLRPERVGWGAGTQALPDRPNVLRAVLGTPVERSAATSHLQFEANIDDMTGELAGHVIDKLHQAGALDAWVVPVTMKKGRPGMILGALAPVELEAVISEAFLRETTSIGVRRFPVARTVLGRSTELVETRFGPIPVKISGPGGSHLKPEFDACLAIAQREGVPVREVLEAALLQGRSSR